MSQARVAGVCIRASFAGVVSRPPPRLLIKGALWLSRLSRRGRRVGTDAARGTTRKDAVMPYAGCFALPVGWYLLVGWQSCITCASIALALMAPALVARALTVGMTPVRTKGSTGRGFVSSAGGSSESVFFLDGSWGGGGYFLHFLCARLERLQRGKAVSQEDDRNFIRRATKDIQ